MQVRRSCIQFLKGCNPHCNRSVLQIYKSSESRVLHRLHCAVTLFQFFSLDVMCWTMCTMAFFCLHENVELDACLAGCYCFPVACNVCGWATTQLPFYGISEAILHKSYMAQISIGKHTRARVACVRAHTSHTRKPTHKSHTHARAHTHRPRTRTQEPHTDTYACAHRAHASLIQPMWCVFTC